MNENTPVAASQTDLTSLLATAQTNLETGNFAHAIGAFRKAVELSPRDPAIHSALGLTLLHTGHSQPALTFLKAASALEPTSSPGHRNLALALYSLDDRTAAIGALEEAVRLDPGNTDALLNLGQIHKEEGRFAVARQYLEKAIVTGKADAIAFAELAEVLLKEEEFTKAADMAMASYNLHSENPRAARVLAEACTCLGRLDEARFFGQRLIELAPDDSSSYVLHAKALIEYGDHLKGAQVAKRAIDLDSGNHQALSTYAHAVIRHGKWDEALEYVERALAIKPDNVNYITQRAGCLSLMGRTEEAFTLVRPLVHGRSSMTSDVIQLYARMAKDFGEARHASRLIEHALAQPHVPKAVRSSLCFAAGRLYHSTGQHDRAFECYDTANRLKHLEYDHEKEVAKVERTERIFTREYFASVPAPSQSSRRPIFIVGMPRSGTSLTEKIIASHSEVFPAGELLRIPEVCQEMPKIIGVDEKFPLCMTGVTREQVEKAAQSYLDYIDELDGGVHSHVTDKLPGNCFLIGLIATAFPDAAIIHCRRNALDTCLSCYFENFAGCGMDYTYSLEGLGRFYGLYERVMAHWHTVLPGRIYDLNYEAMVQDPEPHIRRLLQHCGLGFEQACLQHHKSDYRVTTASHEQVRQPIYTGSVNRWRKYEAHLQPLVEALAAG